jgi:branched-subunit amino acid permease
MNTLKTILEGCMATFCVAYIFFMLTFIGCSQSAEQAERLKTERLNELYDNIENTKHNKRYNP